MLFLKNKIDPSPQAASEKAHDFIKTGLQGFRENDERDFPFGKHNFLPLYSMK